MLSRPGAHGFCNGDVVGEAGVANLGELVDGEHRGGHRVPLFGCPDRASTVGKEHTTTTPRRSSVVDGPDRQLRPELLKRPCSAALPAGDQLDQSEERTSYQDGLTCQHEKTVVPFQCVYHCTV